MSSFLKKVTDKTISRRSFLKATAAGTAGLALTGCGSVLAPAGGKINAVGEEQGEWISAACWHNCGGRCLNKALVVDGVVIRQKTDDTHEDSPDYPQQRGCLRGRSQRQQVFGADRLKYPMKRKHWQPGGGDKSLRGQDEWERISWDEALAYIADELNRVKKDYGNRSILHIGGWSSRITDISRTLGLYGGYCEYWNTNSFGSWAMTPKTVGFMQLGVWDQTVNDRFDLRNCETIIMLSMNPAWSAMGSSSWHYRQAKKAGAKFIGIDPFFNATYSMLGAQWVPVRPSTDAALLLAIAYVLITKDHPTLNPLIDWEFLNKCAIGFDAEHMPEGEDPKGNFKDHVLGTYDGVPKTPEWASEICGVSEDQIEKLALEFRKDKKVAFICGMASGRTRNSDNLPQLIMTIGAMTGHMGKSGHMTGSTMHATSGNGGPALVCAGSNGLPGIPNPVDDSINAGQVWDAILNGKYNFTGSGDFTSADQYKPGEERDIDIRIIYHSGGATLQTNDGMTKGIEAHRKVDLVVSHSQFVTTNSKYADIVLPVTTEWEKIGGFSGGTLVHSGNREMIIMYSQISEPLYEARSDQWIAIELAKKLGIDEKEAFPFDEKQQFFNALASTTVVNEDGKTYGPLVTITQEDIDELGVTGKPQTGKITYRELKEKGVYQVKRYPGDNYGYIAYEDFVRDPENNPLSSESGKLEIYSRKLAKTINDMGFSTIQPIPSYIKPAGGFEDTFQEWEGKAKGEYPYQVINPHYLRRSHTVFDNVKWLQEAWPNPVFLNTNDARDNGLADGDTVLITSPYGKILRNACLTERVRPGVVALPHGAWVDMDEKTGIDVGGADNILSGQIPTGQGVSGFNTGIARIEKYTQSKLIPDVEKAARIVFQEGV
ncbi:anaerobic dehydrogenase, typically selenocysteine-containing [Desulfitobacterium dehalogenans ATCC 51507]|uniref:Anaerobic dehydrogenase, typically selenocysteine-containing n=1 Tax=Desulfitobacterium dehalogenans (strain ATCC 51507 / DSM 9161 / JW/IU-DC1) TaxID=756499 RepID=I4A8H6_DESDJ|nr:molybdopterin-dependent oxidoreductase [Desulfitobacterium dehalogenans]AFM00261.1 anaerobic dehydrogenase, typically selenocysteine-containing [Desulfitobacterium dehalogenans ATCC 51507]